LQQTQACGALALVALAVWIQVVLSTGVCFFVYSFRLVQAANIGRAPAVDTLVIITHDTTPLIGSGAE
jgi:hypothetical protein